MKCANGNRFRYRLTSHAKKMLIERGIKDDWVERVLKDPLAIEPDKEDPTLLHALGRIPELGDRILRVVYNQTMKPWLIVTAFLDRKAGRVL